MGAGTSSRRLGERERVMNARNKLEADKAMQTERTKKVKAASTETLNVFVESIADSFRSFSPFSDPTLLVAFEANPEETHLTQRILRVVSGNQVRLLDGSALAGEWMWLMRPPSARRSGTSSAPATRHNLHAARPIDEPAVSMIAYLLTH